MWRKDDRDVVGGLQKEMNRLFEDFFGSRSPLALWSGRDGGPFMPACDIRETEDKVLVDAELPGVDPKDVDIRVEGNSLIIRGERKHEEEKKGKGWHRVERSFGLFERQLELPEYADATKCEATYKNGVLTIELPKKPEAKPRSIKVNVK